MDAKFESLRTANRLPPLSPARLERLKAGIPIGRLSVEARISAAQLSRFERGLSRLSPAAELRRRAALKKLAAATP